MCNICGNIFMWFGRFNVYYLESILGMKRVVNMDCLEFKIRIEIIL